MAQRWLGRPPGSRRRSILYRSAAHLRGVARVSRNGRPGGTHEGTPPSHVQLPRALPAPATPRSSNSGPHRCMPPRLRGSIEAAGYSRSPRLLRSLSATRSRLRLGRHRVQRQAPRGARHNLPSQRSRVPCRVFLLLWSASRLASQSLRQKMLVSEQVRGLGPGTAARRQQQQQQWPIRAFATFV